MSATLDLLRHATASYHEGLHHHPLLKPLQSEHITFIDYTSCLQAFYAAYHIMEKANNYRNSPDDVPVLKWLEQDFACHDITPLSVQVPECAQIDNYSRYMGYCYVKQGSTLGGQVISKHLKKYLGLQPYETNYFFAGYEDTGKRWKQFLTKLDDDLLNGNLCVEQAIAAFAIIRDVCDEIYTMKTQ